MNEASTVLRLIKNAGEVGFVKRHLYSHVVKLHKLRHIRSGWRLIDSDRYRCRRCCRCGHRQSSRYRRYVVQDLTFLYRMTILSALYLTVLLLSKALIFTAYISPIILKGGECRRLIRYSLGRIVRYSKKVLFLVVHTLEDVTQCIYSAYVD